MSDCNHKILKCQSCMREFTEEELQREPGSPVIVNEQENSLGKYPVWWSTSSRDGSGQNTAKILAKFPYTGSYPEFFNYVLRLEAPDTHRGWMEMAVFIPE